MCWVSPNPNLGIQFGIRKYPLIVDAPTIQTVKLQGMGIAVRDLLTFR
jgi:hypothetical protein